MSLKVGDGSGCISSLFATPVYSKHFYFKDLASNVFLSQVKIKLTFFFKFMYCVKQNEHNYIQWEM